MVSFQAAAEKRELLETTIRRLEEDIAAKNATLTQARRDLYDVSLRELHLREIYRRAKIEIPRLRKFRKELPGHLTEADVAELEKWIAREKTTEGLARIADAMEELRKYRSYDIRTNLYALIQRIIIEGAYKGRKK